MKVKKIISYFLFISLVLINVTPAYAADRNLQESPMVSPYYSAGLPIDYSLLESDMTPFQIIPPDDRYVVKNTTVFPYSAVCSLDIHFSDGYRKVGTGFMVAENILITAGHCLYSNNFLDGQPRLAQYVHIYPGRQGNYFPFGSAIASPVNYNIHPTWLESLDDRFDMASIFLDEPIGNECGWFGYDGRIGNTEGQPIRISGYPAGHGYQVYRSIGIVESWSPTQMLYLNDTEGGDSGAPVYGRYSPFTALGIHLSTYNAANRGKPITLDWVLRFLINGELDGFTPVDPGGGFEPEPGGGGGFQPEPVN